MDAGRLRAVMLMAAALLADKGFTSSEQAIEAPRGFAHVMSTRFDPDVITEGLGERYELANNMYKPFACGLVVHAVIDGCIELSRQHDLRADAVESVELTVNPIVLELTGKTEPRTGLEGKFSVYHAAAIALIERAAGEAQFSDASVLRPEVMAVRRRVRAEPDPEIRKTEARIRIVLRDGTTLDKHVEHALGTIERPLSDADIEAKFHGLVEGVLSPTQADTLARLAWDVASLDDAAAIASAAVP